MPVIRNSTFGQGSTSSLTRTAGNIRNATRAASAIRGAAENVQTLSSAIRSANIPLSGEVAGDIFASFASFLGGDASPDDWRVRLSLPLWPSFRTSAVLEPLKQAGGLIFPYTPQITMKSGATYKSQQAIHTNYPFRAYQNSSPGVIEITAPMNVEDQTQALYWIASVHYLRSLTKMFSGADPKAGNPPPVVYLNGYGQYVFKNVPVTCTNFSCNLPNDCDYIGVNVVGSMAGMIGDIADSLGGLTDVIADIPKLNLVSQASSASKLLSTVSNVSNALGTFGIGGSTSAGVAYVPTKSSFSVTLEATYSRASTRTFSLDKFVSGGYVAGTTGYI